MVVSENAYPGSPCAKSFTRVFLSIPLDKLGGGTLYYLQVTDETETRVR